MRCDVCMMRLAGFFAACMLASCSSGGFSGSSDGFDGGTRASSSGAGTSTIPSSGSTGSGSESTTSNQFEQRLEWFGIDDEQRGVQRL